MHKTIPTHLIATYQLLTCAFPEGIDEQYYLPVLSILYEQMSDRNLAQVVAELTGRDYHAVLNDVYRVGATPRISPALIDSVQQKLMNCNYKQWLASQ
jgi:hypothetical protein